MGTVGCSVLPVIPARRLLHDHVEADLSSRRLFAHDRLVRHVRRDLPPYELRLALRAHACRRRWRAHLTRNDLGNRHVHDGR